MDFFADLVTTGTVLGLDHTSDLDEVVAVLGDGLTKPLHDDPELWEYQITDTGLVEFGWCRPGAGHPWEVTHFGAQAHRLEFLKGRAGRALVDRYGKFRRKPLRFADLDAAVRERGFALVPDPAAGDDHACESGSGISVVTSADGGPVKAGVVLKVLGSTRDPGRRRYHRLSTEQRAEFVPTVRALLAEPDAHAWLDRYDRASGPDREHWWFLLTDGLFRIKPHPIRLILMVLREAAARKVNAPGEDAAWLIAEALRAGQVLDERELREHLAAGARLWLGDPPADLPEAAKLTTATSLTPAEIRLSRLLRDQIHVVATALPRLAEQSTVDRLRSWTALKPRLLRGPLFG